MGKAESCGGGERGATRCGRWETEEGTVGGGRGAGKVGEEWTVECTRGAEQ